MNPLKSTLGLSTVLSMMRERMEGGRMKENGMEKKGKKKSDVRWSRSKGCEKEGLKMFGHFFYVADEWATMKQGGQGR